MFEVSYFGITIIGLVFFLSGMLFQKLTTGQGHTTEPATTS